MARINLDFRLSFALPGGGEATLRRCDDQFFSPVYMWGARIAVSTPFMWPNTSLPLAKIYAALTMLTGPSGRLFDHDTGAFAFPFKLAIRRGEREARYVVKLTNIKGWVHPDLYRLPFGEAEPRPGLFGQEPHDDELSSKEFVALIDFFFAFLESHLANGPPWTTPFVAENRASLYLFGYDPASGFFEDDCRTKKDFDAASARRSALPDDADRELRALEEDW
jgi:hypothetical protein